jgi:hypothetical protein
MTKAELIQKLMDETIPNEAEVLINEGGPGDVTELSYDPENNTVVLSYFYNQT